ncbi:MAG: hypothetical protein JWM26_2191 [Betaproteobacteria bacterium]|jgi:hypothetical protein|nr:hypothetical protein [Betaproteobacteria bacterium]
MMNPAFTALVAVALLSALGGCAGDMRWSKPGADAASVSRDMDDCRGNALRHAAPQGPGVPTQDGPVLDRGATTMSTRPGGNSNERFIAEHEDVRLCMLRRGYQLAPAS